MVIILIDIAGGAYQLGFDSPRDALGEAVHHDLINRLCVDVREIGKLRHMGLEITASAFVGGELVKLDIGRLRLGVVELDG